MALAIKGKLNDLILSGGTPLSFYKVEFHGFSIPQEETTLCKAVSLPGLKKNTIDFWYDGVKYPVPREVQHAQTIEVTFYQDLQDRNRKSFMDWMKEDYNHTNTTQMVVAQYSNKQLDEDSKVNEIELLNVFPTDVSDVKVGYDKAAELGEFTVTLSYSTMRER